MHRSDRKQFHALTALRGIAALMVVVYHFSGGFLPNLDLTRHSGIVPKAYLWVDLFFLLSGFVLMHVYGGTFASRFDRTQFRTFLLARAGRIYPLHLFMLTAFLLLELVKLWLWHSDLLQLSQPPFSVAATRSLSSFMANVLMLQSTGLLHQLTWNGPAWSIGAEWYAYIAFPVLALLAPRTGWTTRVALVLGTIVGLALLARDGSLDVTYRYGLVRCLLEFVGGMILYLVYQSGAGRRWLGSDAFALVVIATLLAAMHLRLPDLIFPLVFAAMILALAHNDGRATRSLSWPPLLFLGAISYSIYMLHVFVLEVANLASRTLTGRGFGAALDRGQSLEALIALTALVVVLSVGLHRYVEVPGRALLIRAGTVRTAAV